MSDLALRLDASEWPLVHVEPTRTPDEADVQKFLDAFKALAEEHQTPYAIVLDLRAGVPMPQERRTQLQQGMLVGITGKLLTAEAMIMGSAARRLLLGLMLKVAGPKHAMKIFAAPEPARRWALSHVAPDTGVSTGATAASR